MPLATTEAEADEAVTLRLKSGFVVSSLVAVVEEEHPEAVRPVDAEDGEQREVGDEHDGLDDFHRNRPPTARKRTCL